MLSHWQIGFRALFDRHYNFYLKTRRFSLTRVVGFQSQTCSVDDWMFSMLHGLRGMKLQSRCPCYSSTRQRVRAPTILVRVTEGCFARGKMAGSNNVVRVFFYNLPENNLQFLAAPKAVAHHEEPWFST